MNDLTGQQTLFKKCERFFALAGIFSIDVNNLNDGKLAHVNGLGDESWNSDLKMQCRCLRLLTVISIIFFEALLWFTISS